MITANVKRFIELQTQVNNQIDWNGKANPQLADELEALGDQLTNNEISTLSTLMEEDTMGEMEYKDIEWMIK